MKIVSSSRKISDKHMSHYIGHINAQGKLLTIYGSMRPVERRIQKLDRRLS